MSSDNQEKSQREKKVLRKKSEELLKITEEAERKARYQKEQKQREDKERKKAADLLNKFENRFNEKKKNTEKEIVTLRQNQKLILSKILTKKVP